MITDETLRTIRQFAREKLTSAPAGSGYDHAFRVYSLASSIAPVEGASTRIVQAAALLHDCGKQYTSAAGPAHEQQGAELAGDLLARCGVDDQELQAVVSCIREHHTHRGPEPSSLESKCLWDADKIDLLGATGVARAYLNLEPGGQLYLAPEVYELRGDSAADSLPGRWQLGLKDLARQLYTGTGRSLAQLRSRRMQQFINWLAEESQGRID